MKNKIIVFVAIFGFLVTSCYDLELEPKGILGEPELFGNEFGIKKYFTGIYFSLPIEDFVYYVNNGYQPANRNRWEAYKNSLDQMSAQTFGWPVGMRDQGSGYWPYDDIRDVNVFINNFPNYKDTYDEITYNALMGEARFFRAFMYQGMAKRYGGVPIITEVQDPINDAPEVLNVSRATEYDTWKFIYDDLKFAMENMVPESEPGRANKYVAASLMSRSMLYAGRVAKYTQYLELGGDAAVEEGLAGIDPSKANEFFQYSYDAGKMVEQGPYSLYNKDADKADNFANLFLDPSSPETIFIKDYDGQTYGHCYDALCSPRPDFSSFVGTNASPTLNMMQMFEFPSLIDAEGKPVRFDTRTQIKDYMEPRLKGTVFFDGDELRGTTFSIQRGIYLNFDGPASDAQMGSNAAPVNAASNRKLGNAGQKYQGIDIIGKHGLYNNRNRINNAFMGAFIRKNIDPSLTVAQTHVNKSKKPWIVFRLGEIYLNTAEAAYELGKRVEALDYIELLRERAGCTVTRPVLDQTESSTYGYAIENSLQFIRDERARELYMENHYWWDIRLYRIADQVLNNYYTRGLSCYYLFDEDKYIYIDEINKDNRSVSVQKRAAYEPIPQGEINKNTNLLPQNPLW